MTRKKVKIFNNNELNHNYSATVILPLYNKQNNIKGCVILLNYVYTFDDVSLQVIKTIKQNIEFYSNIKDEYEIKKYENNDIYNRKHTTKILNNYLDELFIDKNYKHIEESILIKINSLKNNLRAKDINLLNEILNLLEEKKEYYAIYAISLGMNLKK